MEVGWWQLGLGILVFLGGCIGVSVRIGYIVANTVRNITVETDAKIGRVYERFDQYKEHMEHEFVRRESCGLTHSGTTQAITSLCLAVDKLNDKIDSILLKIK